MTTLFISDLHLEADRPEIADQFLRFLETEALQADALYILGDLFEAWVGDERATPQPGNFYGGWVTSRVVGPFKGEPGSQGW